MLILIIGKAGSGRTTLINRVISALKLDTDARILNYTHDDIESFSIDEQVRRTDKRTIVLDTDDYPMRVIGTREEFLYRLRHYNANLIITLRDIRYFPRRLKPRVDYIFTIYRRGRVGLESNVPGDINTIINSINSNWWVVFPDIPQRVFPVIQPLDYISIREETVDENVHRNIAEINEELHSLSNILFDNKEKLSDGDYVTSLNNLRNVHNMMSARE